jgi:hypothetical protein
VYAYNDHLISFAAQEETMSPFGWGKPKQPLGPEDPVAKDLREIMAWWASPASAKLYDVVKLSFDAGKAESVPSVEEVERLYGQAVHGDPAHQLTDAERQYVYSVEAARNWEEAKATESPGWRIGHLTQVIIWILLMHQAAQAPQPPAP